MKLLKEISVALNTCVASDINSCSVLFRVRVGVRVRVRARVKVRVGVVAYV